MQICLLRIQRQQNKVRSLSLLVELWMWRRESAQLMSSACSLLRARLTGPARFRFRQAGWRAHKSRPLTTAPRWLGKLWRGTQMMNHTTPSAYLPSEGEPKKRRRTCRRAEWDKSSDFSCLSGFLCRFTITHMSWNVVNYDKKPQLFSSILKGMFILKEDMGPCRCSGGQPQRALSPSWTSI